MIIWYIIEKMGLRFTHDTYDDTLNKEILRSRLQKKMPLVNLCYSIRIILTQMVIIL
jgi:hypothetical protein